MNRFRDRLARFMYGRYGYDQLGKIVMYASFILLLISLFFRNRMSSFLYLIGIIGLIYSYYRIFSRQTDKRYQENQKFLNWKYKIVCKFSNIKRDFKDRKTNCIFKCPNCQQKIRVPKGKGRICIKCPKCRIEFIKKT